MARELGAASQSSGGSINAMAPPPTDREPPATQEAGLFTVFAVGRARPSSADYRRPKPSPTEPSRAQPNSAPLPPPPPPECRRTSELAAPAAEEAPPQGEEVPAHRRPPAAEAAPVAPRRERPAEAARPRGRAGGVDVAPACLPPPPARRLSSLSLRRASRCPGPSRGREPGSTQVRGGFPPRARGQRPETKIETKTPAPRQRYTARRRDRHKGRETHRTIETDPMVKGREARPRGQRDTRTDTKIHSDRLGEKRDTFRHSGHTERQM